MPKPTENDFVRVKVTTKQKQMEGQREHLDKVDLMRLWDWSVEDQKEAQDLILEYASICAMHDMDLGKTPLLKHIIRLIENTPFKES